MERRKRKKNRMILIENKRVKEINKTIDNNETILYHVFLRAKKDYKAFKWVIENYYRGWPIRIEHVSAGRKLDDIVSKVSSSASPNRYNFLLLGWKDLPGTRKSFFIRRPDILLYVIGKGRIRNVRLEELSWEFEKARAFQRNCIEYNDGVYRLFGPTNCLFKPEPFHDVYFLHVTSLASGKLGLDEGVYVVVRGLDGKQYFLGKDGFWGYIQFLEEYLEPRYYGGSKPTPVDPGELVKANIDAIKAEESIVAGWLQRVGKGFDRVIVPWSGGKDSTTVLYLALRVFGTERVYGVYAHLDTDLPGMEEFIDKASEKLGLKNLLKIPVGIRDLVLKMELPSHDYRWCTGLKVDALENTYRELCSRGEKCLIISGDRDVESEKRSGRPPIQVIDENIVRVTPLKQWSTLLLQLYMYYRGIPVNPYYEAGFYRLGCFMCPSLRNWEIFLMLRDPRFKNIRTDPVFKSFLESRMKRV